MSQAPGQGPQQWSGGDPGWHPWPPQDQPAWPGGGGADPQWNAQPHPYAQGQPAQTWFDPAHQPPAQNPYAAAAQGQQGPGQQWPHADPGPQGWPPPGPQSAPPHPDWNQPPPKSPAGLILGVLGLLALLLVGGLVALAAIGSHATHRDRAASSPTGPSPVPVSPTDTPSSSATASASSSTDTTAAALPPRKVTMPHATFTVPAAALVGTIPNTKNERDGEFVELTPPTLSGYYTRYREKIDPAQRASSINDQAAWLRRMSASDRHDWTYTNSELQCQGPVTWTTTPYATTIGSSYAARTGFSCHDPKKRAMAGQIAEIMDSKGYVHFFTFTGTKDSYTANKADIDHIIGSLRPR